MRKALLLVSMAACQHVPAAQRGLPNCTDQTAPKPSCKVVYQRLRGCHSSRREGCVALIEQAPLACFTNTTAPLYQLIRYSDGTLLPQLFGAHPALLTVYDGVIGAEEVTNTPLLQARLQQALLAAAPTSLYPYKLEVFQNVLLPTRVTRFFKFERQMGYHNGDYRPYLQIVRNSSSHYSTTPAGSKTNSLTVQQWTLQYGKASSWRALTQQYARREAGSQLNWQGGQHPAMTYQLPLIFWALKAAHPEQKEALLTQLAQDLLETLQEKKLAEKLPGPMSLHLLMAHQCYVAQNKWRFKRLEMRLSRLWRTRYWHGRDHTQELAATATFTTQCILDNSLLPGPLCQELIDHQRLLADNLAGWSTTPAFGRMTDPYDKEALLPALEQAAAPLLVSGAAREWARTLESKLAADVCQPRMLQTTLLLIILAADCWQLLNGGWERRNLVRTYFFGLISFSFLAYSLYQVAGACIQYPLNNTWAKE